MMPESVPSLVIGTWDREHHAITFNGNSPEDGGTFVVNFRFLDKDHGESRGALKNAKGEIFQELTQPQTRRPEEHR